MITEIKLSNFRGFDNHTIPLRPVTIIVGKNNAGKSTVVKALRLISAITRRFQGLNYCELPSWVDRPRRERGVFPSTDDFEFSSEAVFYRLGDPPARIAARFSTGEQVEVLIGPQLKLVGIITDSKGEVIRSKGQANRVQLPQVGILPQIGPLLREETVLVESYVRRSVDSSRSSLHFRNQLHFMRQHFSPFKHLAESTWHGVSVSPVETKQLTPTEKGLSLFVRDHDFTAEIGWMGHGLQMWLQTMWFLTHAGQSSSIILDEPDVYMHADLQRRLIRLLRTRHHQTLIATHSVEIMSEVEPDEILVIDRRKRNSTFAGSQPEVQSLLTNIGSIHNIQLARLNAAGRFVMVEGDERFDARPFYLDALERRESDRWRHLLRLGFQISWALGEKERAVHWLRTRAREEDNVGHLVLRLLLETRDREIWMREYETLCRDQPTVAEHWSKTFELARCQGQLPEWKV